MFVTGPLLSIRGTSPRSILSVRLFTFTLSGPVQAAKSESADQGAARPAASESACQQPARRARTCASGRARMQSHGSAGGGGARDCCARAPHSADRRTGLVLSPARTPDPPPASATAARSSPGLLATVPPPGRSPPARLRVANLRPGSR